MHARLIFSSVLTVLALATAGAALAVDDGAVVNPCGSASEPAVAVANVIDGDTLSLADGRTVHVAGIEAVKAGSGGAPVVPLAEAARREITRLVEGSMVRVSPAPPAADRYGRLHAAVRLADGRSLGTVLVAAGLARVRLFPGEKPCLASLFAAEAGARAARRGLWALPAFAVRQANDPSLLARTGLYELVEGRVASVGHGKYMVFLDFGRDYQRDFTIMVPTAMVDQLPVPVDAFKGRQIRVRGVIEESGGPAIRLGAPEDIELRDGS